MQERNSNYQWRSDTISQVGTTSDLKPSVIRNVKALGVSIELDLIKHLEIYGGNTLKEIADKYPTIATELQKRYTKGWLEKYNQVVIDERNKYIASVDKLYNELLVIHTELGYKSDVFMLEELNDLLYCEAEGFLLKMEEKIEKKNNPKNLKLYKALQVLRNKPIITCESK